MYFLLEGRSVSVDGVLECCSESDRELLSLRISEILSETPIMLSNGRRIEVSSVSVASSVQSIGTAAQSRLFEVR